MPEGAGLSGIIKTIALAAVDLRLRLLGFQHVMDSLDTSASARMPTQGELRRARYYAGRLQAAARHHIVGPTGSGQACADI